MRLGMEGPTRPQGDSEKQVREVDYLQRLMRSLADSSTSLAHSADEISGMESGSYSFIDSYDRIPHITPALNPRGFIRPLSELRGQLMGSSEPGNWRSSNEDLSPIEREILADFPWLKEELAIPASTSVVSKEESDGCTSAGLLKPSIESMLGLQAFENSSCRPEEVQLVSTAGQQQSPVRFVDQALSTSFTPPTFDTTFNTESSSSLSDGDAELHERTRKGSEAAGSSAQSGKRTRKKEENGEGAPSDAQEASKKPIRRRPRKKGGVKRVREPRYAIKTRTEIEVMDDGYKWRKYGQKAVKNSPYPRNYYRCTTANCPVRKRVERCFEDPGLVVTTYESTHTHQSPRFLLAPPGYTGELQGLLATLRHHYHLAGKTPLPLSLPPGSNHAFSMSNSDLYRSSPLSTTQPPIHENLNVLGAHEHLLRLQQREAAIKKEPPARNVNIWCSEQGPSFSGVSSFCDLSNNTRVSSLANACLPEQLGHSQINPLEYSSLIGNGPLSYVVGLPDLSAAASSDSGLLGDMFRHTNPSSSN